MKPLLLAIVIIFSWVALAPAEETYEYPSGDPFFTISFPDKWIVEGDDQSLSAFPKDETVSVELVALEAEEFDDAIDEAVEALAEEFDALEVDEPQEGIVNGLDAVLMNATAAIDGEKIGINICLFAPERSDTVFMMFFFAVPDALEKHGNALNGILQSIKNPQ